MTKLIAFIVLQILVFSEANCQMTTLTKTGDKTKKDNNVAKSFPYVTIAGLGNISKAGDKLNPDPTANIRLDVSLSKRHQWSFYTAYNIGGGIDSSNRDSTALSSIFFPDRSKGGFGCGFNIDLFRLKAIAKGHKIWTAENVNKWSDSKDYNYYSLSLYAEYLWSDKVLKDKTIDSSHIRTGTWILGLRGGPVISIDGNSIAVAGNMYMKGVFLTDGTYDNFNRYYGDSVANISMPHHGLFLGLGLGVQINKVLFSFAYEYLLGKSIPDRTVWGGIGILKATVDADVLKK